MIDRSYAQDGAMPTPQELQQIWQRQKHEAVAKMRLKAQRRAENDRNRAPAKLERHARLALPPQGRLQRGPGRSMRRQMPAPPVSVEEVQVAQWVAMTRVELVPSRPGRVTLGGARPTRAGSAVGR